VVQRFQRGWLRQENRKAGPTWVLRYKATRELDGKRVEHTVAVGLVKKLSSESAAWQEVERRQLNDQINKPAAKVGAATFGDLAKSYLDHDFARLSPSTQYLHRHNIEDYLLPRWGKQIAVTIEPLQIESWLKALNKDGLAAPTTAKIRGIMLQVYKHGQRLGLISRSDEANPVKFVRASAKTAYKALLITPAQAYAILRQLEEPARTLAILSAATGLRISESLGLQWQDIDTDAAQITVRRTWLNGKVGKPKTEASEAPVPMQGPLGEALSRWRAETPYAAESDWVFASFKLKGRQPREGNMLAADYLRPAAVRVGVLSADDRRRFGWHNFRHSLASYLVANGTDAKTVQDLLRHSKVQTTLDLYSQSISADRRVAQGQILAAIFGEPDAA
jgi:integrase